MRTNTTSHQMHSSPFRTSSQPFTRSCICRLKQLNTTVYLVGIKTTLGDLITLASLSLTKSRRKKLAKRVQLEWMSFLGAATVLSASIWEVGIQIMASRIGESNSGLQRSVRQLLYVANMLTEFFFQFFFSSSQHCEVVFHLQKSPRFSDFIASSISSLLHTIIVILIQDPSWSAPPAP
jgi:hypothetical protein